MEFAIFWLPLIAGLLLGGLAVGAWYGGDKTLAIWVGFVGAVCLVLLVALQIQQEVWRTANQPNITLLAPNAPSILRWDPPHSYQMQINDHPTPQYGAWKVPVFPIRNSGSYAQDATIKWAVAPYEIKALIKSSDKFKAHRVTLENNQITLGPKSGPGTPFIHPLEWSASIQVPFITRETETFIPLSVWEQAALFFIATMSDEPTARSAPFFFDVQVKWNIPEGGEPQHFRVKAVAINAKPPVVTTPTFLANIKFEVMTNQ